MIHRLKLASRGHPILTALLLFVVATSVIVYAFHLYPRHGADRVEHLASWPPGCSFAIRHPADDRVVGAWHRAVDTATIDCQELGPNLQYARFPDGQSLTTTLSLSPPHEKYCVARDEVVVDGLFTGGFEKLCRKLAGTLHPANAGL